MSIDRRPATSAGADDASGPLWEARSLSVRVEGEPRRIRLVHFAGGWIASADTVHGPTLGVDHSPYLAVQRAVEPLGIGLVEALTAVGGLAALVQGTPRAASRSAA